MSSRRRNRKGYLDSCPLKQHAMGTAEQPALQVIVLGSGGGPMENNTTAFLVRSVAAKWQKGSVLAVDAGVHLAAIARLLEEHSPTETQRPITLSEGPFAGLEVHHSSPSAIAGALTREQINTYLITHPHLDHISGFVVNTAALPGSRSKRLAGLPSTIEAFKNHIFNNVIWPNLSDENNGASLVTYIRLVEGGSPALGEGEGKGYLEICEGLSVKTWSVSHGHCIENHSHRGSSAGLPYSQQENSPRMRPQRDSHLHHVPRQNSIASLNSGDLMRSDTYEKVCVYDSSAYFIRDQATGREVLIFGDVEPDTISLSPRNRLVWHEAAPKIASGRLSGIFIECSYDDSRAEDRLYGHVTPRHLVAELKVLADEVAAVRASKVLEPQEQPLDSKKKRKRMSDNALDEARRRARHTPGTPNAPISPRSQPGVSPQSQQSQSGSTGSDGTMKEDTNGHERTYLHNLPTPRKLDDGISTRSRESLPLYGVKIIVIHVKENLLDGPDPRDLILEQLKEHEEEAELGCEFLISYSGHSVYF